MLPFAEDHGSSCGRLLLSMLTYRKWVCNPTLRASLRAARDASMGLQAYHLSAAVNHTVVGNAGILVVQAEGMGPDYTDPPV